MEKVAAAGNKSAAVRLSKAEVPPWLERSWEWFWELKASSPEGFGSTRISYQEILAWATLTRSYPNPWEVRVIRAMDIAQIVYAHEKSEKDKGKPKPSKTSRRKKPGGDSE